MRAEIQLWLQLGSGWVSHDDVSLCSGVTYNLTYNAENRLASMNWEDSTRFLYAGEGRRVKATLGGVTTVYVGIYSEWTGGASTLRKLFCI